jgi:hypothetical protein
MASLTPRAALGAAIALSAILGCSASDSTRAGAGGTLSLSFASTSTAASANVAAALVPITSGGHTLDLTKVELNLSKVELHSTQHGELEEEVECEHSSGCGVIAGSPLVVTLSPTSAVVTVTTALVPPGTYREIEVKVSSVHLVGTFDAKAFDVVIPVNVKNELEFRPPVTIGDETDTQRNVTIAVSLAPWLTNPDGSLIDPAKISTDPVLRASIAQRIRATFRAFRDDNRNNRDDDNDEHRGGHDD